MTNEDITGKDDVSFLRTEDMVCLSCTTTSQDSGASGDRVCLAAEGFGNRMCFLQSMADKDIPFDISVCVFVLEQALSVRALQEMVSARSQETAGGSGGHRTLLYGHAVLLRHSHSRMYLSCLSTQSSSSDKLAFDVGLTETSEGESCWWTIHPASKQRSEGEKVRVGDDLILVSVASERYLHIGQSAMVMASFQQTLWTVQPISSGAARQKSVGYVFGGDVLRLFHGDECLTIPSQDSETTSDAVMYEAGAVQSHARSLWKLEHVRMKWAEGFMGWSQPFRLRHITSGRYLAVTEDHQVVTFHRSVASESSSAFVFRQSKDDRKFSEGREDEGMGTADIKYGDTLVYVQHIATSFWLSYKTFETKKRGVGRVEEKKAVVMVEGHMDDGLNMSMAQEEENKSARVIRKCTYLITRFVKALESLKTEGRSSRLWEDISLGEVIKTLEDLIEYFAPPPEDMEFEERQVRLKALRNRQDLFQEEGMIALILETIDHCSQWKSLRHLAHVIGEDSAGRWNDMISYLYFLLAAMIKGNHANCSLFASSKRLDWLLNRLESQESSTAAMIKGSRDNCKQFGSSTRINWLISKLADQGSFGGGQGVLDVLHCVLIDSPEALNVIKEQHIRTIISLIDKHGRDPKVLDVLCSLCVGNEVAVRSNQNLICENLLPGRDLLLQTGIMQQVYSMHPNLYMSRCPGSSMYQRWYYEAAIDHVETITHMNPVIRIGWANTEGFVPYPGGGSNWGANGLGDDLFSYSFDGVNLWTGCKSRRVGATGQDLRKGDIVGVSLDLTVPEISFTLNGNRIKGFFRDFNLDGMFYPVVSISAKLSVRFLLGGEHGQLQYGPPDQHSPVCECLLPKQRLRITPCFNFGDIPRGMICGPQQVQAQAAFVPQPVETAHIQLPAYIENVQEKLAENIHELWTTSKIEQGWTFAETRDDRDRTHPCLTSFERLPQDERTYNLSLAHETLKTLLVLGYHVSFDPQYTSNVRMKTIKFPNSHVQSNGYKPAPLDVTGVHLSERIMELVDLLAENTHNIWAKERIRQGWTYGMNEDPYLRRTPHLVPYANVDDSIKKANRETSTQTLKTIQLHGYNLELAANEAVEGSTKDHGELSMKMRTYRAERTYAVDSGKWYYEFEVVTAGNMRVGWMKVSEEPGKELGLDELSYAFDGYTGRKWHQGAECYGKIWKKTDVIGCMLDTSDRTISFSLNGELMMDRMGQEIAFKGVDVTQAYVPAISIGTGQQAKINFGQDVNTLKFFTCCGLQEGYEPFCVNMTRQMTLWYGKEQALFVPLSKDHGHIEVVRVPGGSTSPPLLKINSKTYGGLEQVRLEFLRLSLPVKFQRYFVPAREKMATLENRLNYETLPQEASSSELGSTDSLYMPTIYMQRSENALKKRGLFKRKTKLARSLDETSVDTSDGDGAAAAQSHHLSSLLSGPAKSKSRSSILDKFSDGLKPKSGARRKPFKLFRKSKSSTAQAAIAYSETRSMTLPAETRPSPSEYSEESETESMGGNPQLQVTTAAVAATVAATVRTTITTAGGGAKTMQKTASDTSFGSTLDSEADCHVLEAGIDIIDEYYYGVRIFPGQDPAHVYVGWVSPQYHEHTTEFNVKKIRHVVVCSLDGDYEMKSSVSRKNCYLVQAGDLQNRYSHLEDTSKRMTPGLLIGCHVDTSTGVLSFTVNGREVANKYQVEPEAFLFPAVFFEPTNKEVLQIELGRTKTALPLSSVLFRGGKHIQPQCPPRLDVQTLHPVCWSRVPVVGPKVHTLKLSQTRGWSMLCEEPEAMMAIHIPEENRCLDIMELIEEEQLLTFHTHTLELYRAVCSHGNHRAAHELTKHVDETQLMFCLRNKYMPGPLRMGFHQLLISLHLEAHATSRLMTQSEFIVALQFDTDSFSLFRQSEGDERHARVMSTIPSLEKSVSIRPRIQIEESRPQKTSGGSKKLTSPYFPVDVLKNLVVELLTEAVENGAAHIRDPLGGKNETLFVPLICLMDKLLVMGLLDDADLAILFSLIDPSVFDPLYSTASKKKYGLLQIKLSDPVKLELCHLLHHLTDCQMRHRVESIIAFANGFITLSQDDQLKRYTEIKQSDMPMAEAARRTREFRCPPDQQMHSLLAFRPSETDAENGAPAQTISVCSEPRRQQLTKYHTDLLHHCGHQPTVNASGAPDDGAAGHDNWADRLLAFISSQPKNIDKQPKHEKPDNIQKLIISTVIQWAKGDFISDQKLVREMFSLLHRQYDAVGELIRSLEKAYVISVSSRDDIDKLLKSLGVVRSLLLVQVDSDEEELLKSSIWDLADNKVFFQHPDLMRNLGIHETVMKLMVNTLSKAQQHPASTDTETALQRRRSSVASTTPQLTPDESKDLAADMVVSCCRFLCYFCRTGSKNQSAMFEHLSYLLDNSCMLLSRPSVRGSCPLDVAYSSLMDNNQLSLALRECDLDKVAMYLSRCGQQSNQELIVKGYPDIGWDPVEGERFLDFFRFCVWVNGESVEENANLVVRLLIRRPECLGPALRGEGGGLLKAMQDGALMSLQVAAAKDSEKGRLLRAVTEEEDDDRGNFLMQMRYDFNTLPPEDDEDYIDMGAAILNFYSSLVDLLGHCAPDSVAIKAGRSDSLRARAILRSLISVEDLEGVLGLRFVLPVSHPEMVTHDDGDEEMMPERPQPGLQPIHKTAVMLFLERVYDIPDQKTYFRMLEDCFLPDLRAATILAQAVSCESDMALALNRYLSTSVLPLLSAHVHFFIDSDHASQLLDSLLHTVYRLSKIKSLTKNQRDAVSDFLLAFTSKLRPPMMTSLLRKLVVDVPALTENTIVPLLVLTNHYERCGRYYGSSGWGSHGTATEEEKRLTMMLFSGIFDSLAERAYDPELFSKALPCLSAIGCALSPDYALSNQDENWIVQYAAEMDGAYHPMATDTTGIRLPDQLAHVCMEFSEHYHDAWSLLKLDAGWSLGHVFDETQKLHPLLKSFRELSEREKLRYILPVEESLKTMLAWKSTIELDATRAATRGQIKRKMSKTVSTGDYAPQPADLHNVTLTRGLLEMAEHLAENSHDSWAQMKEKQLDALGGGIHPQFAPFSVLTESEKKKDRDRALELLKFLQMYGFRVISGDIGAHRKHDHAARLSKDSGADSGGGAAATEKRFAYSLLEKLLEYVDKAALNMKSTRPSGRFSKRHSFSVATKDVKFFGKVVLPLVERYFRAHKDYFITNPNVPPQLSGNASIKEKEMTACLFSKLALLLRQRITAFGHDVQISVRCLQTLVHGIDARAIVKSSPEIVRSALLPFLNSAADDLAQMVHNLEAGRFSHVKGTVTRGATSLQYLHMVLLPVLTAMFDHLGQYDFGADLLVGEQQLCCYRILNALYSLGTKSSTFVQRDSVVSELSSHRPALGECVASFASTFPVAFLEPQLNKHNPHSILYGIEDDQIATFSLEAKEVMDALSEVVPSLEKIVAEIAALTESGGNYNEAPHVIEVTLPLLCSYLPYWWAHGPDNVEVQEQGTHMTTVTADMMNKVLGNVLKLIGTNIGTPNAPWMNRIATRTQEIIVNATPAMLKEHMLPVAEKLKQHARKMEKEEADLLIEKRRHAEPGEIESDLQEHYQMLVRDMYAFYPLLIKYVDLHRSSWLKNPIVEPEYLYLCVAEVFNLWSKSNDFRKEEQNFVFINEIDNMALIMPSADKHSVAVASASGDDDDRQRLKRTIKRPDHLITSLNVASLKRLLPIGLNMFGGQEQELVQQAKQRLIEKTEDGSQILHKDLEGDVEEFLRTRFQSEDKVEDNEASQWQKTLYKKIGSKKGNLMDNRPHLAIERVMAMSKVLHGLHMVEHPPASMTMAWKKLVSSQRKRAVMACFRMIPLYNLPVHRAINLFLKAYSNQWLNEEEPGHMTLIENITETREELAEEAKDGEVTIKPQALAQLITAFTRAASTEPYSTLEADFLYISYANIMSQSCHGTDDDDDEEGGGEDGDAAASLQEQEMERQKLLFEQSRLSDRGAAEMVLMYISASRGFNSDMASATIDLGISILAGGNTDVQRKMLNQLKDKKDVGFFTSVAGLMQQCSVLDLDAFERCNKAEGLGVAEGAQVKNLHDADNTLKLFRFLQLLCEGHNLDFQNYLRTQAGNTTTVNVVICTVDYLLRLQESIMDFYWHYSGKDTIDQAGKDSFTRAIKVAVQVFRSITEYIQGPCAGNQLALAHSRLWDAVGGFLYIFAHMQDKLSRDPEQLELLREFMKLQKEMMIMLLSMLEGNVVNGPIGKQMVDTLVESSANFEMILKFFDIFLKMKDLATSDAFMEFDRNKDGFISYKEFRRAMEIQKWYSREEIDYVMMCVDANQDGRVDFNEFNDRFHNPAKDIGFNVAVLLTNLAEHIPNDPRLERFLEAARSVLDYFEPYLGRIEIMGSAGRIERVYFEITQSHIDQWQKPQIKESKRAFLHNIINEAGEKGKLECFINFCEDTIFEMQLANSISAEEQAMHMQQYVVSPESRDSLYRTSVAAVKTGCGLLRTAVGLLLSCLSPSNLRLMYRRLRRMTYRQMVTAFLRTNADVTLTLFTFIVFVLWTFIRFIYMMSRGDSRLEKTLPIDHRLASYSHHGGQRAIEVLGHQVVPGDQQGSSAPMEAFGMDIVKEKEMTGEVHYHVSAKLAVGPPPNGEMSAEAEPSTEDVAPTNEVESPQTYRQPNGKSARSALNVSEEREKPVERRLEDEPPIDAPLKSLNYGKIILSMFARNFHKFKLIALAMAFTINFLLLLYKVKKVNSELHEDDADAEEWASIPDNIKYIQPLLRLLALLHLFIAFSLMVAYYFLKVPLVIFKREKEVCRSLEFDGIWVAEQPSEDDIRGHWDKLVISTASFPDKYWDKFVKKKVRNRYSEQFDYDQISCLLGMDADFAGLTVVNSKKSRILPAFIADMDWQYQFWKWGIIFTDNSFLYTAWYFSFSLLGNINYFFYAAHLLDVAICFKTLGTILQSVTHNGKQLLMTVMLTSIIVYIYTVIAFNFFRKFYDKGEDGETDYKCHDMLTCYIFHLYVGVRAGGGIGDEIGSPDGDPYEVYRILFDITFFFFVIIILLAIIQGLIIDAFGELRDQLAQVQEDLESSCFICGIGKDYFDKVPHGFETHVKNEHNFANYMFFLMHLINKPDTEHTGQESYVWKLYQKRAWDFFPVGDCFRKHYEEELGAS